MIEEGEQLVVTTQDLVNALLRFPLDTPVLATWEGVFEKMAIHPELFHGKLIINCEAGREWWGDYGYGDHTGTGWV